MAEQTKVVHGQLRVGTDDAVGTKRIMDRHGNTVFEDNVRKTVFTLSAAPITLTDDAGVGQWGTIELGEFPAGNIITLGAVIDADIVLNEAAWVDTATGEVGLGTTASADGTTLATTRQNIIAVTAIAAMVAQAGPINAQSTAVGVSGTAGGTDAKCVLNINITDDAAHAAGTGTVTGTVTVVWINAGDF